MNSPHDPYFHPLRLVHAAILGGALLFLGIVRFALLQPATIDNAEFPDNFTLYLPIGVMIAGIALSEFMFRLRLKKATTADSIIQKLEEYRVACIIRWSLMEMPVLFAITWFVLYHHRYLMGIALIGMAFIAFSRPVPEKTARHLQLNEEEKRMVNELK